MRDRGLTIYEQVLSYYAELKNSGRGAGTSYRKYRYDKIIGLLDQNPYLKKYYTVLPNEKFIEDRIEFNFQASRVSFQREEDKKITPCAYILTLPKGILKVGKANNIKSRVKQLEYEYSDGLIEVLHTFSFDNQEDAYIMEVLLHKYYKEKPLTTFIPNDRFEGKGATFTEEDKIILEKVAEKIRKEKWF